MKLTILIGLFGGGVKGFNFDTRFPYLKQARDLWTDESQSESFFYHDQTTESLNDQSLFK